MICILTGPVQGGKTTIGGKIVSAARGKDISVGGILCPGEFADGTRSSISVQDLSTGKISPLADTHGPGREHIGRFHLAETGLKFGQEALRIAIQSPPLLMVIDEIGQLEISGLGWESEATISISAYRASPQGLLLLVIRERLLRQAQEKWRLSSVPVVQADNPGAVHLILDMLNTDSARLEEKRNQPPPD